MPESTPDEVLAKVKSESLEFIDFRFSDLPGVCQHVTIPASLLDEGQFTDGHGFDGSSIRGFQQIQESDMVLIADPDTFYVDPFYKRKTGVLHCFVADPVTGEQYSRDPRYIAQKAEAYLKSTGIADTAYFGPEPEFFIFDDVRFDTTGNSSYYHVNSVEGIWNTGADEGPNLGYKPRTKQGYFPVPPMDHYQDLRSEMAATLHQVGIETELHHHEVASGGQGEIGMRFNTLLRMADQLFTFKYILKGVAWQAGKTPDLHAQADLRGQRLGHAHPPVAVEGRRAAVLRRGRLRRAERHRPLVHRWSAQPRPLGHRLHQPDHQQLQAPGAGLRGAGQPGVQPAQPLGVVPHPAGLAEPQGQAGRVPLPRQHLEPVPGLLGHDDGRPRRHRRTASSRRLRSTRTSTTCRPRSWPWCLRCPTRSTRR